MNELEQFGRRLEQQLAQQGATRRAAAELSHCTGATLGRWIRGEAPYSILVLAELHRRYKIDLNNLICGDTNVNGRTKTTE